MTATRESRGIFVALTFILLTALNGICFEGLKRIGKRKTVKNEKGGID